MCRIYSSTDTALYASSTRSVRINGHVTSIRLEQEFWNILEEIAAESGLSTAQFISTLHDEVLDEHHQVDNFTSLLRVICTIHLGRQRDEARQSTARPAGSPRPPANRPTIQNVASA
jgi:predicted DNA-binding ribbon-helix-helix protein